MVLGINIHSHKASFALLRLLALLGLFSASVSASNGEGLGINLVPGGKDPTRVGDQCSKYSVLINQGPNGSQSYMVTITNVCVTGCKVSNVLVNCGQFSSSTFIDPKVFRRVNVNVCLANDGGSLNSGETVSFNYGNPSQFNSLSQFPLSLVANNHANCFACD